jgi:hypothetical protein
MKLTAAHFLNVAESEASIRDDNYDFFVPPSESLAKSAALENARREAERMSEESK